MFISESLTGQKVTLRPFKENDIVYWSTWDVDPEIQEYLPEPHLTAMDQLAHLEYFADCLVALDELHATVVLNATEEPVGTIAITEIDNYHGVGELGIVIGNKSEWGKGIATEAISIMLSEVQKTLRRITAEFEKDNAAVQKSLIKNGFETEAICVRSRIKNGQEIDTVRMVKFLK